MAASQVRLGDLGERGRRELCPDMPGSDFGLPGPAGLVAAGQRVWVAITTTAQVVGPVYQAIVYGSVLPAGRPGVKARPTGVALPVARFTRYAYGPGAVKRPVTRA